jgi:hypothetical protein
MARRVAPAVRPTRAPAPAGETSPELVEKLGQLVDARVGEEADFASFEVALLEVSNELCREVIKKNSRR